MAVRPFVYTGPAAALMGNRLVAPVYPDFHVCDRIYGENLYVSECRQAAINLLNRNFFGPAITRPHTTFPITENSGNCFVSIELAGPTMPDQVQITAFHVTNLILWVIAQCVNRLNGQGGFITATLGRLADYSVGPNVDLTDPYPASTFFVTLTISEHSQEMAPGDNDPAIAEALAAYNVNQNRNKNTHNSPAALKNEENIQTWTDQAARMGRGETTPWWDIPSEANDKDEMNYECDANLGNPAEVDCTHIEWNELPPPSDSLNVGPGTTTFLHSNTCYLAISASKNLVLTWNQIRTAVSTLMNMCIQPPYGSPQGGRAFYRPPQHVGRGETPKKRDGSVTGWNALPPGAEVTIFQQGEPWVNPASEMTSCTWKAVLNNQPVTTCK